jgi:hypothetical protein
MKSFTLPKWTKENTHVKLPMMLGANLRYIFTAGSNNYSLLNNYILLFQSWSLVIDDAIVCKSSEFRCKSGNQCVAKEDR